MSFINRNILSRIIRKGASEPALRRFNTARYSLLAALVLTVVNMVLLVAGGGSGFLFSISIPYYSFSPTDPMMSAIAILVLIFYFLAWLLSKKKPGWIRAALVAFSIDCGYLVFISIFVVRTLEAFGKAGAVGYADFIVDYICHAALLVCLAIGAASIKKSREMPASEAQEDIAVPAAEEEHTSVH